MFESKLLRKFGAEENQNAVPRINLEIKPHYRGEPKAYMVEINRLKNISQRKPKAIEHGKPINLLDFAIWFVRKIMWMWNRKKHLYFFSSS